MAKGGGMGINLPHSIEIEKSILAFCLLYPEQTNGLFELLTAEDFYKTGHKVLFQAIAEAMRQGGAIDEKLLAQDLLAKGALKAAGGAVYLATLMDNCPVPANVEQYCRLLQEFSLRRKLIANSNEVLQKACDSAASMDQIYEAVRRLSDTTECERPNNGFTLVHAGEFEPTVPDYIVYGLFEADTLSLSFGDSGSCKSFFTIDIALCLACGIDFHGLPVKSGPVIYVMGEGQSGFIRRCTAWSIVRGIDYRKHPIYLSMVPASLCDDGQVQQVVSAIEKLSKQTGPPVFIVLDTLARNFGPGDENSTADMTQAIAAADHIRSIHGSAVHLVHHTGHVDKTRSRGSAALRAALDSEYKIERDREGIIRVEATKMKDAPLPEPLAFKLRGVDLPLDDENGNSVTSAILHRVEYERHTVPKPNAGRGANQQKCMAILHKLYNDHCRNVEKSGRCPDSARVLFDDWRKCCMDKGMSRSAFWKAKEALVKIGTIEIENPYVLLP